MAVKEVIDQILNILSLVSIGSVAFTLWILWALWILYVAMMNVQRASTNGKLPWQANLLVIPTTLVFDVIEFIANVVVCTIILWDLPKEITVSDRLRRYAANPDRAGWRMSIVRFIKPMIDPFDHKGPHV